jgi:hypothetical protein
MRWNIQKHKTECKKIKKLGVEKERIKRCLRCRLWIYIIMELI